MQTTEHSRRGALASDGGFTMMEVMVALAIIAIIASASLAFFVQGTRSVTTQQRQQNAVAVANDAMEVVYSRVATASDTLTSGLVVGRTEAEAKAAWNAAVSDGVPGVSDAYPAWDLATTPAPVTGIADDAVPLTTQLRESRIDYTVTTLIGSCFRVKATPSASCTAAGGAATGVPMAGYARIMRTVVIVEWADVSGTCGGTCRYDIAALVDPNSDLEWNNTTRLLAADDSVAVDADKVAIIDVLDNDTLMEISTNPVALVSSPVKAGTSTPMGTAVVNTGNGTITYDPSDDAHGEVTFVYSVTVGARTANATVHVYVKPLAHNYTAAAVVATGAVNIPVQTISGDSPVSLAVLTTPSRGSVVVSGTALRYTPALAGTYSFTYAYTDSEGMVSLPGTVTMTVTNYVPPVAGNVTVDVPAGSVDYQLNLGVPTGYKAKVFGPTTPTGTTLTVDGTVATSSGTVGSVVRFTPPTKTVGVYRFNFRVLDPDGIQSATAGVATVRVQPTALGDSFSVKKSTTGRNGTTTVTDFDLGANDGAFVGTTIEVNGLPSGCGSIDTSKWSSGKVTHTAPTSAKSNCNFRYRVVPTDATLTTSAWANVSLSVTN